MSEHYAHAQTGLSLGVHVPFAVLEEEADRAVLALDAPGRPTLILTVEPVPPDASADELAAAGIEALSAELAAFRLLDRTPATLDGRVGVRTLSNHVADGRGMTLEQWRVVAAGPGVTLTASCPTLDYPSAADALYAAAETLRP